MIHEEKYVSNIVFSEFENYFHKVISIYDIINLQMQIIT